MITIQEIRSLCDDFVVICFVDVFFFKKKKESSTLEIYYFGTFKIIKKNDSQSTDTGYFVIHTNNTNKILR